MKCARTAVLQLWLLLLLALPQWALAGAASGFGLFVSQAGIATRDHVTDQEYAKATFGGGFDYQWALGDAISLGVAAEEDGGDAAFPTLPAVSQHKLSTAAVEARVWLGALFLGYHAGRAVLVTAASGGSFKLSGGVPAGGFALGVEGDGGWFAAAQTITAGEIQVTDGPLVDAAGYRIRLGYRWR